MEGIKRSIPFLTRINPNENYQSRISKEQSWLINHLNHEVISTFFIIKNLLKGDIGHLVNRNESAKLLSSKIAKVKIVADDQLKRVTMAHLKDKD